MGRRISVLLVEDHALLRETLAAWLGTTGDITVVADAANAGEAVSQAVALQPDIVLMDIEMPGVDSFSAAQLIMVKCPRTRVVFLSGFCTDQYVALALGVRAAGYVIKNEPPAKLADAIRAVAAGGMYFSEEVASRILVGSGSVEAVVEGESRASTLTARELEILRHVAKGLSNKEVASVASISDRTVQRHIENIMRKLDLHSRVEMTRFAIREGLATT